VLELVGNLHHRRLSLFTNSLSQLLELHSNNSQSLTFGQRGARDGLHFLGSTRGVLPVGPDYILAFDTLRSSLLSNLKIKGVISSYNYTLDHQGLAVNVSCSYEPTCNVAVTALPNTGSAIQSRLYQTRKD